MTPRLPQATVSLVKVRAGYRCERCGTDKAYRWSLHHRKPRKMGGTKDPGIHSAANLLYLCGSGTEGCHGWVEQHRTEAREAGLLLYPIDAPEEVPVRLIHGYVLLDDGGGWQRC